MSYTTKKSLVLGADPGASGAIVLLDADSLEIVHVITDVFNASTGRFNTLQVLKSLREFGKSIRLCVVEEVHAIFGASAGTTFSFGKITGGLLSALDCMCEEFSIPLLEVLPRQWQYVAWKGITPITKPTKRVLKNGENQLKVDTKETSLRAAWSLFPGESFLTGKKKKPHDGYVDAALIAYYAAARFKQIKENQ